MADVAGNLYDYPPVYSGTFGAVVGGAYYPLGSEGAVSPGPTPYYKMRARDDGVPAPGYVTWVATDTPDFAGAGFTGGTPTPVGSMVVGSAVIADEWEA